MPKKNPNVTPDTLVEMIFPAKGIDQSIEFEQQPGLTAAQGENVRAYEPGTQRARGGARAGVKRYIRRKVGGIAGPVQHLNAIVDPTTAAILGNRDSQKPGAALDPGGEVYLPPGGSGAQMPRTFVNELIITASDGSKQVGEVHPYINDSADIFAETQTTEGFTVSGAEFGDTVTSVVLRSPGAPESATAGSYPITASGALGHVAGGLETLQSKYRVRYVQGTLTVGGISFVQSATSEFGNVTGDQSQSFDNDVTIGDLLIAIFSHKGGTVNPDPTDTLGNTWTLINAQAYTDDEDNHGIRWYYAIANASGPCTVTWSPILGPTVRCTGTLLEYAGISHDTPLFDKNHHDGSLDDSLTWTTDSVSVSGTQLVLGIYAQVRSGSKEILPPAGFTLRVQQSDGNTSASLYVVENVAATTTGAIVVTLDSMFGADGYAGCGASFNPP